MAVAVKCPHCKDGTVVHHGSGLWWQSVRKRCAFCGGVGWILPDNEEEVSGERDGD